VIVIVGVGDPVEVAAGVIGNAPVDVIDLPWTL
jgi:hypothetical protein